MKTQTNKIVNEDGDTIDRVNVMYLVTYDVEEIVNDLYEDHRDIDGDYEPTLDDVLDRIHTLTQDDFGDKRDLIYQDQDGNEL